jgi:uncharacterized protein
VCFYPPLEAYVQLSGEDWARLGAEAERVAHFIGNRAYLRMQNGHCSALETRAAPDGSALYFCTVYERRPQTCRDLERGSSQCEAERLLKGERTEGFAAGTPESPRTLA